MDYRGMAGQGSLMWTHKKYSYERFIYIFFVREHKGRIMYVMFLKMIWIETISLMIP